MIMEHYKCPECGSEYELTSSKIMMRDKDAINCEVCRAEIRRWSGSRIWHARLTKRGDDSVGVSGTNPVEIKITYPRGKTILIVGSKPGE
jgi:DNA-directed RNA polymerase subunit RPC12/RpoP